MQYMDNGLKTRRGKEFEAVVMEFLSQNGISTKEQPKKAPEHVSYSITPDFYIKQSNTWVFAQQALHGGGLQNDRCEHLFQMVRSKAWNYGNVFYVVIDDSIPKRSSREKNYEKRVAHRYLQKHGFLGTKEKLLEVVRNGETMPENKPTGTRHSLYTFGIGKEDN